MVSNIVALLLSGAAILQAQTIPTDIVGTWNSKANSTMTGPVRPDYDQYGEGGQS